LPTASPELPRHIAIIMDGNGRWAKQRGKRRTTGHREGVERVREITTECSRIGIEQLTLYAFSVENWHRPKTEVRALMAMLARFLVGEQPTMMKNNIRFRAIGRLTDLPKSAQREIENTKRMTAANDGMVLCLALSYGGRTEIAHAARQIAKEAQAGTLAPEDVDESAVADRLYTAGMPDPDLLIRTASEMRVSNFLLWQISYAELVVTDVLWPDFNATELHKTLREYAGRERRFGDVKAPKRNKT
jgi:undecaprenyl diphosphate synthase